MSWLSTLFITLTLSGYLAMTVYEKGHAFQPSYRLSPPQAMIGTPPGPRLAAARARFVSYTL
jgi:hypothetical protein